MSFLDQLSKGTTLKHVEAPKEDFKAAYETITQAMQDGEEILEYNIEEWEGLLKDLTFPSTLIPLTVSDAKFFVEAYDQIVKQNKDIASIEELQPAFNAIVERISPKFDEIDPEHKGVFIKTSCRSPKDAPVSEEFLHKRYFEMIENTDKSDNVKLASLLMASMDALKVKSAKDAVTLLSSSERIMQDMLMALDYPDRFREHIVVRPWVDMHPSLEFRCFVKDQKMCAISQYNHLVYYEFLTKEVMQWVARQTDEFFHNEVIPALKDRYNDYVLDLVFLYNDENGESSNNLSFLTPKLMNTGWQIAVIEINPYESTTDGALFSWEREKILMAQPPSDDDLNPDAKDRLYQDVNPTVDSQIYRGEDCNMFIRSRNKSPQGCKSLLNPKFVKLLSQ
eukprot:TRINITY_DN6122_c0_g1_i1.p1 TRINITY_DN6122_c0_g1~~TRINITY_DN6122_c0_g1_i1.p1  ORF type:complete len:394 (+),score=81.63 TRINITY_DN6122_c0_g1_i1:118-1299(+)